MNENIEYTVTPITLTETYPIRQSVLLAGTIFKSHRFDGDALKTTYHLGVHVLGELVGICSFVKHRHTYFSEMLQYQLRGMAVLEPFRGRGLGSILLSHGEALLQEQKAQILWCNARAVAVNFYSTNHYRKMGDSFNIEEIGKHYVMYKRL